MWVQVFYLPGWGDGQRGSSIYLVREERLGGWGRCRIGHLSTWRGGGATGWVIYLAGVGTPPPSEQNHTHQCTYVHGQ